MLCRRRLVQRNDPHCGGSFWFYYRRNGRAALGSIHWTINFWDCQGFPWDLFLFDQVIDFESIERKWMRIAIEKSLQMRFQAIPSTDSNRSKKPSRRAPHTDNAEAQSAVTVGSPIKLDNGVYSMGAVRHTERNGSFYIVPYIRHVSRRWPIHPNSNFCCQNVCRELSPKSIRN